MKHEKLFHSRTKDHPLVLIKKTKRTKSQKKRNKCKSFKPLDINEYKICERKIKKHRHQKSIFEAIQKYAKKSTKSKVSESTACTITKIKAL